MSADIQPTYNLNVGTEVAQVTVKAVPADPNAKTWINNTPVADSDNTLAMPLKLGSNLVTVYVIAENDIAQNVYLLNIQRSLDNESAILPEGWVEIINEGEIIPGSVLLGKSYFYDSEYRTEGDDLFKWYRGDENGQGLVQVGEGLQYQVTNEDVGYYLYLQMTPVTSRGISGNPVLSPGVGAVKAMMLFSGYDLTALSVKNSSTELINNFTPAIITYERSVGTGVTQVTVSATAALPEAIVKVNGQDAASPVIVPIVEGSNKIDVTVENGTLVLKTYLVSIDCTSLSIPQAANVQISGTPHIGETLSGSYDYIDGTEGGTYLIWYQGNDPSGNNRTVVATAVSTLVINAADAGRYLFFEVQPVSSEGVPGEPVSAQPTYVTSYIAATTPGALPEAAANDGSLDPHSITLTIAGGILAADIAKADVTSANLPSGLDFGITRTDDTHLNIDITGQAAQHADFNDVDNLTFTIALAKVSNAGSDLTSDNISLDFNNPPQPPAPTNPVVDDSANTFGWTNAAGFSNISDYQYSTDNGTAWSTCTANPQAVGDNYYAAGDVQVRVKADAATGRADGAALVSNQAFTIALSKPTGAVLKNHTASWAAVAHENNGYLVRLYKDGLATGDSGNIAHGDTRTCDFLAKMDPPGSYTVRVIALGAGQYGNSPESAPSDPQVVLETGGINGQAQFSTGTTALNLGNDGSMDFQAGVASAASGQIVVGGLSSDLDNYSGGDLVNQDLSAPLHFGDQTVQVQQAVRVECGVNGQPITITNSDNPGISVVIPDGTAILAGAGWDGMMIPPLAVPASGSAPQGFTIGNTLIEVGSPGQILIFDKAVTIEVKGVTGTVGYKPAGSNQWLQITQQAGGSYDTPLPPAFAGEAYISNGTDTKIITWHFSNFGNLYQKARPMGVGGEVSEINKFAILDKYLTLIILTLSGVAIYFWRRRIKCK